MNVLLINHYAGSIHHGMEYRPFYLAREWVRHGHRATVAAASFSHVRTVQPILTGPCTNEEIEGIRYFWLKTPSYSGNGMRRAVNIFNFVYQLSRFQSKLLGNSQPEAVIASSTYPLDILPAWRIAKKNNSKLIFEVHDLWPLSPIELGGMSPRHPYIMLLQWAENFAYRHADYVVSMLPKAESYMRKHGLKEGKFVHIPNGVDLQEWSENCNPLPQEHAEVLSQIKESGKFIVGYAGAHGLANSLYSLVDAAALMQNIPAVFVFVGQGPEREPLQKTVREKDLKNVVFLPPVPKKSIPALLNSMDALYIGLKSEPLFRFGISPNKLLDYMISGKPVIHAIRAGNDMVAENRCGISIAPDDPRAAANAIKSLMDMPANEREEMGFRGREYVIKNHDYRILAQKFLDLI